MSVNQAIWRIEDNMPVPVTEINLDREKDLEELIFNDIGIINS